MTSLVQGIPVFYRGVTVRVLTGHVLYPSGAVIPADSPVAPLPMMMTPAPFTDVTSGMAADPQTVSLMVSCAGKRKVEYDYPTYPVIRLGVGMYQADLQTDHPGAPGLGAGLWTVEWAGTGGVAAFAAMQFYVVDPPVIPSWL